MDRLCFLSGKPLIVKILRLRARYRFASQRIECAGAWTGRSPAVVRCAAAFVLAWIAAATVSAQENAADPAAGTPAVQEAKSPDASQAPPSSAAGETGRAPVAPLPQGVLARVNNRDVTLEEYASYLVATFGKSRLDEYINRILLEEEANRLQIEVAPSQVETELAEEMKRVVASRYSGDEQKFAAALRARRTSIDEYRARRRQRIYYATLEDEVIRQTREVTDALLEREFERVYGPGGVQLVLRHILIALKPVGRNVRRGPSEAQTQATRVLAELDAGLDFGQAVRQYTDDPVGRENDGRIPQYRKGIYGEEFERTVAQLTPQAPRSGVIMSSEGAHIVELVERRTTKLDDVKADVEALYRNRAPTVEERQELMRRLRQKAEVKG